jgi:hypothetical protein
MRAATSNPAARSNSGSKSLNPKILESISSPVDLVGVFFMLWGVLTILIAASTLALGVAAAALINSAAQAGGSFAAGVTAAAFTTLALMAALWGGAHVIVGLSLRRLRHWSRLAALSLGAVDLLLLPYGTAVGAYALWVLLRDEGKRPFA